MKVKIFLLLFLCISLTHAFNSDEIQNAIKTLVKKNCGGDFFEHVDDEPFCSRVDKYDAAAVLALLCGQDLITR